MCESSGDAIQYVRAKGNGSLGTGRDNTFVGAKYYLCPNLMIDTRKPIRKTDGLSYCIIPIFSMAENVDEPESTINDAILGH